MEEKKENALSSLLAYHGWFFVVYQPCYLYITLVVVVVL